MSRTLRHRGPDDEGHFIDDCAALACCRLSIIDPEGGHQPLPNEDRTVWISHNGEIYNFPTLREELRSRGHRFSTLCDTETIVHAYEEWGEGCVHKLRGMFAFSLWDSRSKKLLLVRDRLGIKPLYYTLLKDRTMIFGSELKALIAHPEVERSLAPEALDLYLTLEYIPSPHSVFKNVYKLPPGCLLVFQEGNIRITRYWKLESLPSTRIPETPLSVLMEKFDVLLRESVRLRLRSDVPLGAQLSGGMDSSSIVALMRENEVSPLKTFSIGFEESSYDELPYARRVARRFHTEHHEYVLQPRIIDLVQKLITHLDEPLADTSLFPTYLVSRMARSQVKVILAGEGGDELFGGYDHYLAQILSRKSLPSLLGSRLRPVVKSLPPAPMKKGLWNKFRRFCLGFEHPARLRHLRWMMFFTLEEKKRLYTENWHQQLGALKHLDERDPFQSLFPHLSRFDEINGELYIDLKTYLADSLLSKIDRMSMAASLETRVPLLDHRLVEFVFPLAGRLKIKGLSTKWLLRRAMQGKLPPQTLRRSKQGFSIPIKHWLRKELKELMLDYLSERRIRSGGIFRFVPIKKMVESHLNGRENYSHQLWALIVFEIWKERYL